MNIASFYNESGIKVYDMGHGRAAVQVNNHTIVDCELRDSPTDSLVDNLRREFVSQMRETALESAHICTLWELTQWANRRGGTWYSYETGCEECEGGSDEGRTSDWQVVCGLPINRRSVREAIQWLHETPHTPHDTVTVGQMPHGGHHVLVIRCGDWSAAVMQGRSTEACEVGKDSFGSA